MTDDATERGMAKAQKVLDEEIGNPNTATDVPTEEHTSSTTEKPESVATHEPPPMTTERMFIAHNDTRRQ